MTPLPPMNRGRVFKILTEIFQEFGSVYGDEPTVQIMSRVGITMKESANDPFDIDFYDEDQYLTSVIRIVNPKPDDNEYTIVYQDESSGKQGRITITRNGSVSFGRAPLIGSLMYTSIKRGISKLQDYVRELTQSECNSPLNYLTIMITGVTKTTFIIETADDGDIPVYWIPTSKRYMNQDDASFVICYDKRIIHCLMTRDDLQTMAQYDDEYRRRLVDSIISLISLDQPNAHKILIDPNDLHIIEAI